MSVAWIEQDFKEDSRYQQRVLDRGDAPCSCTDSTVAQDQAGLADLVNSGSLAAADAKLHSLCDFVRSSLEQLFDPHTWNRDDEKKTECEPQVVTLAALCGASLAARDHELEAVKFFSMALITLHKAGLLGCYDRSGWPFMVEELFENFERLLGEGPAFRWIVARRPFQVMALRPGPLDERNSAEKDGSANLMELCLRLRSLLGLVDALWNYWHRYVQPETLYPSFPEIHESGSPIEEWTYADLCGLSRDSLLDSRAIELPAPLASETTGGVSGSEVDVNILRPPRNFVRVLNALSGMFVPPRELHCEPSFENPTEPALRLEVTSVDSSARAYLAALSRQGWAPKHGVAQQCDVEELWRCFPSGVFELVHVRNGMDHMVRPLQGIRELVRVTRPGGRLVLWHWQNEHPETWKSLASGSHQWGFDLCPTHDPQRHPAAAKTCDTFGSDNLMRDVRDPILWNYAHAYNLTFELMGVADVISARYEEDPVKVKLGEQSKNYWVVIELRRKQL